MPEDLPIYSEPMLRTRLQFADLDRLKAANLEPAWEKSDAFIEQFEGGTNARQARESVTEMTKNGLLRIHSIVFSAHEDAGALRQEPLQPPYRGQDCPDPQFIDRSLDNFFNWLTAESVAEIHPIEKAALMLTRIVDIWPFEYGNQTVAIMAANLFLREAGLTPFFVLPRDVKEFNTAV